MFIDLFFLGAFAWGFVTGVKRSFLHTVFSVMGYFIALLVSMRFTPVTFDAISHYGGIKPGSLPMVSFGITFLLAFLVVKLLAKAFTEQVGDDKIENFNRYGGGLLLGFVFLLLAAALAKFAYEGKALKEETVADSQSFRYVVKMTDALLKAWQVASPVVQDFREFMQHHSHLTDIATPDTEPTTAPVVQDSTVFQ